MREREGERLVERAAGRRRGGRVRRARATDDLGRVRDVARGARDAARDVAIVIGGAFGLGDRARARRHARSQLAPWTLPHELARLVLAEQLYRAGTIARGEPYHK